MFRFPLTRGILAATLLLTPVMGLAEMVINDPYARTSRPNAPTGAAFMTIENTGDAADRLVSASSDIAKRVELHTHIDQGDGVMKMTEIEGGIEIDAGATYQMQRGGDHVMFMGLVGPLEQGADVSVTLTFERAGEVVVTIPVDNERQPKHGVKKHGHSDHNAATN